MVTEQLFPVEQTVITSDDHYTPPHIFERLGLRFDLDVCAPPGGVAWVPADHYYTQADDALVAPWHGRVWMNPPFSNPTPFVEKFIAHANGVALVPTSSGRWTVSLWEADVSWACLQGVKFHSALSGKTISVIARCWLVAAGDECEAALAAFGRVR